MGKDNLDLWLSNRRGTQHVYTVYTNFSITLLWRGGCFPIGRVCDMKNVFGKRGNFQKLVICG